MADHKCCRVIVVAAWMATVLLGSSSHGGETAGHEIYQEAIRGLESLGGYRGSGFSETRGRDSGGFDDLSPPSQFCVKPGDGRARIRVQRGDSYSEILVIDDQAFSKSTSSQEKWSTNTVGAKYQFPPRLREKFEHALPAEYIGSERVGGSETRHFRGRYDVGSIVEEARALNLARGGSLAPITEKSLRNTYSRSYVEFWIDSHGVPRKVRSAKYTNLDMDIFIFEETLIEPGCDDVIAEPGSVGRYEAYIEPTGLAVVHYTGKERREFHGGECFWMGSSGAGTHRISYTSTDYTMSIDVGTTGGQFKFEESLSERPELAYARAGWSRGDDLYDLKIEQGEVNLAPDLRSFSFEAEIADYGQEGSNKRFRLAAPTRVSFQVTCPNEPKYDPTK